MVNRPRRPTRRSPRGGGGRASAPGVVLQYDLTCLRRAVESCHGPREAAARLRYMDRVGRSVAAGLLTDNPDVAQGHRTYRGLREWIRAQVSDLRKTCPGGVRTALVEAGLALGPSSTFCL